MIVHALTCGLLLAFRNAQWQCRPYAGHWTAQERGIKGEHVPELTTVILWSYPARQLSLGKQAVAAFLLVTLVSEAP